MGANASWTTNIKLLSNTANVNTWAASSLIYDNYASGQSILPGGGSFSPGFGPLAPQWVGGVTDPLAHLARQGELKPETPEQWLRRRVRETCWVPA